MEFQQLSTLAPRSRSRCLGMVDTCVLANERVDFAMGRVYWSLVRRFENYKCWMV